MLGPILYILAFDKKLSMSWSVLVLVGVLGLTESVR